ncbi:MAG: hypothetical protein HY428_00860 [Candidatus Levybacteria bacterium]|nr:hypothetical protein [Candidatus Levybacteria bacterium]
MGDIEGGSGGGETGVALKSEARLSWSERSEQPLEGLQERLDTLRKEQLGKAIVVGSEGNTTQVGHILPVEADHAANVVILDNGLACIVSPSRHDNDVRNRYFDNFSRGNELIFPEGTKKADIFGMIVHGSDFGVSSVLRGDDLQKQDQVIGGVQRAFSLVAKEMSRRVTTRQNIARTVNSAFDSAMSNASSPKPSTVS